MVYIRKSDLLKLLEPLKDNDRIYAVINPENMPEDLEECDCEFRFKGLNKIQDTGYIEIYCYIPKE